MQSTIRRIACALCLSVLYAALSSRSGAQQLHAPDDHFRALIERRDSAFARGDTAAVHRLISDDLVWIDGVTGRVINSPQLLTAVAHAQIPPRKTETDSVHAHGIGDMVIVDSRRINHSQIGTRDIARTSRASDVFVNRNGRWLLTHHTQVWIPTPPVAFPLDSVALNAFVGRYELAPGFVDNVHWSGGALVAIATGEQGGAKLVPVSATVFRVSPDIGTVTIFERDSAGRVTGYVSHWPDGRAIRARKLE